MLALRSLLFNAVFYLNLIVQMIFWSPLFFLMPRKAAWFVPKSWARGSLRLQERLAGTKSEITGLEIFRKARSSSRQNINRSGTRSLFFPTSATHFTS